MKVDENGRKEERIGGDMGAGRQNEASVIPKQEDITASVDTSVIHLVCSEEMKNGRVWRDGPHASRPHSYPVFAPDGASGQHYSL